MECVKSKNLFCDIPRSDRFFGITNQICDIKTSFCDDKMRAPINNLINARALNFVSAGIGNTLGFLHGSQHFIN